MREIRKKRKFFKQLASPRGGGSQLTFPFNDLRRLGRFFLADGAAHFIQTGSEQFLLIERRAAREQFVEQHAQAVDVAARVNVQAGHHRLLGTHVGRCADELLEGGEERLVGQPSLRGLGDAEVNHLGDGHAVVDGDEDVRGLDVAVNDAPFDARAGGPDKPG